MTIKELDKEHFGKLEAIFNAEFDSDPPRPDHSKIFVAYDDDGDPVGFVHAEQIILLGQVYVVPEKRNSTISVTKTMIDFLRSNFDGKANVAAVASEPRFEQLFKNYGMQMISGTFHRKNVDFE
jgi:hypothetical protein